MRKRFQASTDKVWFTADLHLGHKAVIQHSKRPFENVEEMDMALVDNWNAHVGKRDHVFILGDFSFRPRKETIQIARAMNGIKYLIEGNHDRMIAGNDGSMFEGGVEKYHEIWIDKTKIVMCHFAFRSWNLMHYGSWNLHGHSHGNLSQHFGRQLDVGVDCMRQHIGWMLDLDEDPKPEHYCPISYSELKIIMDKRPIHSDDHHQPKEEQPS